MDRKKVLFITALYPTKENPIEGIFVREHAKAIRLADDDVVVLHCSRRDGEFKDSWVMKREGDENLTDRIPTFQINYRQSKIPKTTYLVYLWSVLLAFRKIVNEGFRPDIIHAHIYKAGVPAVLIGKIYGIPVVITEHFTGFSRKVLSRIEILKAMFAFRLADGVLPVSSLLQKAIEEYGIRAMFQVVPNVVDTDLFFPMIDKGNVHYPKKILFVGLLDTSHKKGIPHLLRALGLLQQQRDDWVLDIVGDGPARKEYEQAAAILKIADKITFHGMKSKKEVAEFMRHADLFVLPSLFETFSVVTAEALATGTPVLATNCGGPEQFVTEETGLLVPPGNIEALFNGLDYMLNNLERFRTENISHYATEHFSHERVGEQLHRVYLECIARCKG